MASPVPPEAQLARVLTHPLRPRILELLTVRGEASPNQIAGELGESLGRVSYHVRMLRDVGWIELVRTLPRRGAVEHVYRVVMRPFLDDAQWERIPVHVRRRLAALTVDQILRSAAVAAEAGGFDRPGAHVDRVLLELDGEAWSELSELLDGVLEAARQIQERSNERRSNQVDVEISELAILHYGGPSGAI
jgi:DNA-binding transcriptional ArsR family regulator